MKARKKTKTYADKQRTMVRILCLVMCALMVLGVLAAALPYLGLSVRAAYKPGTEISDTGMSAGDTVSSADPLSGSVGASRTTAAAPLSAAADNGIDKEYLLRIGLMFGSGVTESYRISAKNGFLLGSVNDTTNVFTPYFQTSAAQIEICQDANLTKKESGFVPASQSITLGGYHLQLPETYADMAALTSAVASVNQSLQSAGIYSSLIYAFPAYDSGKLYVRIGDFGSSETAAGKSSLINTALGKTPTVVRPDTGAGLTVIDPVRAIILFEHRGGNFSLGAAPAPLYHKNGTSTSYEIETPVGNIYEGVFSFARYSSGVSVTNIIDVEDYIAGVIPYEIGTEWGDEALKAFAVIVRSYAFSNLNSHSAYHIDLCNDSCCQAYRGCKRTTDRIREAVAATRGQVITYKGEVCRTCYSAVTGGSTVNSEQVWNGASYPYLRAVQTPWEEYATHPKGEWVNQVDGTTLCSYLRSKGYTSLRGSVQSMEILEKAENSSYIYRLKVTDSYGNSVTIKGTANVRAAFGTYVNSANFVIAHNGEIPALDYSFSMHTADGDVEIPTAASGSKRTIQVLTADGVTTVDVSDGLRVKQSADTEIVLPCRDYDIPEKAKTLLADKNNHNFILIGKGWGHGCGFSQWGIMNLADLGYTYPQIIDAYLTDVSIVPYTSVLS